MCWEKEGVCWEEDVSEEGMEREKKKRKLDEENLSGFEKTYLKTTRDDDERNAS